MNIIYLYISLNEISLKKKHEILFNPNQTIYNYWIFKNEQTYVYFKSTQFVKSF